MIIRQKDNITLWGPGIRPISANSGQDYVITDDGSVYEFDTFPEADEKYCQLSGEKSLNSTIFKQI